MALQLVTAPTVEPVTVSDAKDHLRIDDDKDDVLIESLITAAREWAEKYQNRAYLTQTWDLFFDDYPAEPFSLPKPPLQSVTHIKYYDTDETETEFSSDYYQVDTASFKGRIALDYGQEWPTTTLRSMNGFVVRFIAGYGDDASDVPEAVKTAIKMIVAELYENREVSDIRTHFEVPFAVKSLLGLERIWPL